MIRKVLSPFPTNFSNGCVIFVNTKITGDRISNVPTFSKKKKFKIKHRCCCLLIVACLRNQIQRNEAKNKIKQHKMSFSGRDDLAQDTNAIYNGSFTAVHLQVK